MLLLCNHRKLYPFATVHCLVDRNIFDRHPAIHARACELFWPAMHSHLLSQVRLVLALGSLGCVATSQLCKLLRATCNLELLAVIDRLVLVLLMTFKLLYLGIRRQSLDHICCHAEYLLKAADFIEKHDNYTPKHSNYLGFYLGLANFLCLTVTNCQRQVTSDLSFTKELNGTCGCSVRDNYQLYSTCQAIGLFFAIAGVASGDSSMMRLVLHIAKRFRLISYRFRVIGQWLSVDDLSNISGLSFHIGRCISQHQIVIRLALEASSLLRPIILSQLLTSNLTINLTEFATKVQLKRCVVLVVTIGQTFAWNWLDKLLVHESVNVAETIYQELPHDRLPKKIRRDFCLVLFRAQNPCCLVNNFLVADQLVKVCNITGLCITTISQYIKDFITN